MENARAANEIYRRALRLAGSFRMDLVSRIYALLEEAAELDHTEALFALANWRHFGIGNARDDEAAARMWSRASLRGHAEATFQLAIAHERGIGVPQDRARAYELYLKAASAGIVNGLYEIGRCTYYGIGAAIDRDMARAYFRDARLAGHAEAAADAAEDGEPRRMPPPAFMGPFHATRGGAV
jgi:TPR repeat protein